MPDNQPPDTGTSFRTMVAVMAMVAQTLAVPVVVFLHKPATFGERYMGMQAAAATVLIFFWPIFCEPAHDPRPMFLFLVAYLFMCLVIRIRVAIRVRRGGPMPHTRYTGEPRLMRFVRNMSEVKVKCILEPVIVWLIGGLTLFVSPRLGGFLMFAGVGLFISNGMTDRFSRQRALDMHDAFVEQRGVVDQFRDLRGD